MDTSVVHEHEKDREDWIQAFSVIFLSALLAFIVTVINFLFIFIRQIHLYILCFIFYVAYGFYLLYSFVMENIVYLRNVFDVKSETKRELSNLVSASSIYFHMETEERVKERKNERRKSRHITSIFFCIFRFLLKRAFFLSFFFLLS